jgi:Kdo2-lipid IVA lauroyltransferase/acyltransferase
MNALIYYLTIPFIYLISLLPCWWMYRLSDFLFIIIYHVFGYRRKVVNINLINSFPEKTASEIRSIEKRFYRYFCDLILETLKTLTISRNSVRKRVSFNNAEVLKKYYVSRQSVIIVMGHWGNWELGGARFALESFHKLFVIYHPLHNQYFDKLVYHMRTRLGNGLYSMAESIRGMIRDKGEITATAFIADQTPSPKGAYWMQFLNQDTPVFTGTGKIAKKLNYPVVYVGINRTGRGYYEMTVEELVPDTSMVDENRILELFTHRLEQDIRKAPEIWLWTHRRWKHKRQFD